MHKGVKGTNVSYYTSSTMDFATEKRVAIKAAKELCYRDEIIERLKKAITVRELDLAMAAGRHSR